MNIFPYFNNNFFAKNQVNLVNGANMTNRRQFLHTLGLATASLSLFCTGKQPKPNILLVLTDDQGWGDIGSHDNPVIDTPVMDRLAASGARFERFYVSPVCAPTRASLLTGRYHLRTNVTGVTRGRENMRANEVTLAEILESAGYATGCFGKWHNGAYYPYHPNGQGFRHFLGFCAGHWNNYFDTGLEHNGVPVQTKGYINDVLTDAAVKFIRENTDRPFFCYVPYNTPHSPFQVPDKYFDKYKAKGLDDKLACVYGMCENLDDCLGRLLDTLEQQNLTEKTIVLFITDNGPNGSRYNGDMRGHKGSPHEGGSRVPCFISWPGHIGAGTTVPHISAHIDILPTLVDLAGIRSPNTLLLDGKSLKPLLEGRTENWPDRHLYTHWVNRGAVRTPRYRAVKKGDRWELYDMLDDPGETRDLGGEKPDLLAEFKKEYEGWYREVTGSGIKKIPIPVGYKEMPVVTLTAHECTLRGAVEYKGGQGWANDWVTGWRDTASSISWDIDVVRPGGYRVSVLYTCPEKDVGSRIRLQAGSATVEGVVQKAHDPQAVPSPDRIPRKEVYEKQWAELALGTIELEKGPKPLELCALSKPGDLVFDVKAVRLEAVI